MVSLCDHNICFNDVLAGIHTDANEWRSNCDANVENKKHEIDLTTKEKTGRISEANGPKERISDKKNEVTMLAAELGQASDEMKLDLRRGYKQALDGRHQLDGLRPQVNVLNAK